MINYLFNHATNHNYLFHELTSPLCPFAKVVGDVLYHIEATEGHFCHASHVASRSL